jgi:hypothetical protein
MENDDTIQTRAAPALDHSAIHREIVFRKLRHARTATQAGMKHGKTEEAIRLCDKIWEDIIASLQQGSISQAHLPVIEKALAALPGVRATSPSSWLESRDIVVADTRSPNIGPSTEAALRVGSPKQKHASNT